MDLLSTECQNLHFAGQVFFLHHSGVNIVPVFLIILVSWLVSL